MTIAAARQVDVVKIIDGAGMLRKTIYATLFVILATGAASPQMVTPKSIIDDRPFSTKELKEYRAVDREYRSAIKKIPDQKRSDPWGDIRTTPPQAATKNKQQ
jgi:hypothetical protein